MSEIEEFNNLVEEVNRLRQIAYEFDDESDNSLIETSTELAKNHLRSLQICNEFFEKVVERSELISERLESEHNSILMPDRKSARNLIALTHTTLKTLKEIALNTNKGGDLPDGDFFQAEKIKLSHLACSDLSNEEFNRDLRHVTQYYTPKAQECEFGDSTINTIASEQLGEHVFTSSPI